MGDLAAVSKRLRPKRISPAAVLVPLIDDDDGLRVLLTQRARHLKHHPGQISFPGGRIEAGDQ
ncbi:MAG: NUDIX domain-containing protein, partial [Gammaproteobacteria bacterium]|nr:NUDIX domain-containing protein [Gammaproteobacteria bacterium]